MGQKNKKRGMEMERMGRMREMGGEDAVGGTSGRAVT